MTTVPYQLNLFTGQPTVASDVVARVTYLLEQVPTTRDSYPELVGRYWLEFCGLDEILLPEHHEQFIRWLNNGATNWKTIVNRAMEVQRQRSDLDSSPEVRNSRNRQATQGIVR